MIVFHPDPFAYDRCCIDFTIFAVRSIHSFSCVYSYFNGFHVLSIFSLCFSFSNAYRISTSQFLERSNACTGVKISFLALKLSARIMPRKFNLISCFVRADHFPQRNAPPAAVSRSALSGSRTTDWLTRAVSAFDPKLPRFHDANVSGRCKR